MISPHLRVDLTEMKTAHRSRANDDCENSIMLTCRTNARNSAEIGAQNDDIRSNQTMKLLVCASAVLAGWYALRYLGRQLSASACVAVEQLALRDSTSDRRSAARWENEGGAMLTDHHDAPLHRK